MKNEHKSITSHQAAKLIYRTDSPTAAQVAEVEGAIESGLLAAPRKGGLLSKATTTPAAVASFLAEKSMERRTKQFQRNTPTSDKRGHSEEIGNILKTSLREYFLAVLLLRKSKSATTRFECGVIIGQVVVLTVFALVTVGVIWSTIVPSPASERIAIEAWLDANTDEHEVQKVCPPADPPTDDRVVIRVEYRYRRPPGRTIQTMQYFTIENNQVTRVDSEMP